MPKENVFHLEESINIWEKKKDRKEEGRKISILYYEMFKNWLLIMCYSIRYKH